MPRYEWTGGPNILGALDPRVQVSGGGGRGGDPTILRQRSGIETRQRPSPLGNTIDIIYGNTHTKDKLKG